MIGNDNNVCHSEGSDISIDSLDHNDYNKHTADNNKELLDVAMEKMISDRNDQDNLFKNMTDVDFGSAIEDKYGISSQMGFMVGNEIFGHQKSRKRDIKEETLKAYKELTDK